tara:strand:- start:518 stop:2266 length:1749 start_codon:yes stop_codon:yes gene_type:complete
MKFKGTVGMVVAFLILGVYYFFVDLPAETKKAQEKEIARKVLPFKSERVKEFSLVKQDQTITLFQNSDKIWGLSQPFTAIGDTPAAETFLSGIENLEKSRVVETNPKNLSQYGLEPPSFKIRLQFKDGTEEILLLGDDSAIGDSTYLKLESSPAVLLSATSKKNFNKSVYDFRDKTIFNFSSGSINQIQIKRKDGALDLIRHKNQWEVFGNVEAKAEKDKVLSFLRDIQFSRIQEFESENPKSLTTYGLDSPHATLILKDENKQSYVINLGSAKNSSGYYGKKNGSPGVFVVNKKFYNTLKKETINFLNKTLIDFEENNVTGINIRNEEETIQAIRAEKDNWRIYKPQETDADMKTIRSFLFDLKEAKITKFIKLSPDSINLFGLNEPKRSFSITTVSGKSLEILFGKTTIDGNQFFAKRTGESTVFSVSKQTAQKLFRTFHEFRNKKIFKFKTDDVNKIVIQTRKTLFELKKSDSHWNLFKPEKTKIKKIIGNDILWTLQGMEFESFLKTSSAPAFSGLNSPAYKVSLWKNNSEKFVELLVGNPDPTGQKYFAKIEDQKGYYQIKKKHLDAIPLNLDRFKS